jgi:hypothetical protein
MRLFNSFQIVSMFACVPFVIAWLSKQTFNGAFALLGFVTIIYGCMFCAMIYAVYNNSWKDPE